MHRERRSLFQLDRRFKAILALPFEIPILDPDQWDLLVVRRGGFDFHLAADQVHVWYDAVNCDIAGKGNRDVAQ